MAVCNTWWSAKFSLKKIGTGMPWISFTFSLIGEKHCYVFDCKKKKKKKRKRKNSFLLLSQKRFSFFFPFFLGIYFLFLVRQRDTDTACLGKEVLILYLVYGSACSLSNVSMKT